VYLEAGWNLVRGLILGDNSGSMIWKMIDLHTHSILSDGVLVPAELVQQARNRGYKVLGITDHCDASNLEMVISCLKGFVRSLPKNSGIAVLFGVELTHLYPEQIGLMVKRARRLGAELVVIHGETLVEPVPKGTNQAGILAGADIIAHPGLIEPELVNLAVKKGVYLELTSRRGHCLSNGWVGGLGKRYGARLIVNTDSHSAEDLLSWEDARKVVMGAGLSEDEAMWVYKNSEALVKRVLARRGR